MKREEEKWNYALKVIEAHFNRRNYIAALEFVEEFLSHSKFPQRRLPALMKKAMCCFGAWHYERKYKTKEPFARCIRTQLIISISFHPGVFRASTNTLHLKSHVFFATAIASLCQLFIQSSWSLDASNLSSLF